jgi:hypothetical protein
MKSWMGTLNHAVEEAKKRGHLKPSVDPRQLAFEIYSLAIGAHWASELLDDEKALRKSRETIRERIRASATANYPAAKVRRQG